MHVLLRIKLPSRLHFSQWERIRPITIHLVCGHVHKRRFRAGLTRRFEQIEGSHRIHFKVEEGNVGRSIMRGLGGSMDDDARPEFSEQGNYTGPIADIEGLMPVASNFLT